MIRQLVPIIFLLLSPLIRLQCQEDDKIETLLEKALHINIQARLISVDGKAKLVFKNSLPTFPGRSLFIRLTGKNIQIYIVFTPYEVQKKPDKILLLAQGQIWLSGAPDGEGTYSTFLKNIPITFGETIHFYPLGVPGSDLESRSFSIELEIQVIPYNQKQQQENTQEQDNGEEMGTLK